MTIQTIDIDHSPSGATQAAANTQPTDSIAFDRGRQSLNHSVWYNGSLMTFLATGEDTQGQFALIEAVSRKGTAPPPHIHRREAETFYVLEGEVTVLVGDRTVRAVPGTMVFLPRNVQHSFTIESEQARMLVLISPAGFEGWFQEFSMPAPEMTLPPVAEVAYEDVQRMLKVAPRYGLEFALPERH